MKKTILMIDNDLMLNKINEKVLRTAGIVRELHIATNGLEALNYLLSRIERGYALPDIIIFELEMPVMNGVEFIEEFGKLDFPGKGNIELIIFTSTTNTKIRSKALSTGIKNYLEKPYILRGLTEIISRLNSKQQTNNLAGAF
jgi:CheY-like chemotaxis protein